MTYPAVGERGRFIVFEGVDGCGKTTQSKLLAEALGALWTREPGATALGQELRSLLLDHGRVTPSPVPRAETLMMLADRAQHLEEVVIPALEGGRWVVSDRFVGSTIAYQGHGRGFDSPTFRAAIDFSTAGVDPDLVVLLTVEKNEAAARMGERRDRFEALGGAFFEKVRAGYEAQAAEDPTHWLALDGTGAPDVVAARILSAVSERLLLPQPVRPAR